MSLLFHTLLRFVIAYFPQGTSIFLKISWLQSFGIMNPEMDSLYLRRFFLVKKIDMESSIIAQCDWSLRFKKGWWGHRGSSQTGEGMSGKPGENGASLAFEGQSRFS